MTEKTYEPEVISETPFPGEVIEGTGQISKSGGTYQPTTTGTKPFKRKRIATELLSTALNTHSRKILGEFEFSQQGAIQVGEYQNGISGDLRISPNGITARDNAGLTTFNLDGTDGSAVFKGTVQAGSFISGSDSGATVGEVVGVGGVDFTDIQDAIDFVNDLGGGTVFIQNGTYLIDKNIYLYSNINLVGQDSTQTILDFNNSTYTIMAVANSYAERYENIYISNLQIINCKNITEGAIYFKFVHHSEIIGCQFTSNYDSGADDGRDIHLRNTRYITIKNCTSTTSGYLLYESHDGGYYNWYIRLENCNSVSSYKGLNYGIGRRVLITGNLVNSAVTNGIHILGSDTEVVISNNVIAHGQNQVGYSLYVTTNTSCLINSNYFSGIYASGNHIIYLDSYVKYAVISNNKIDFTATGKSGIYLNTNCDYNIINSNNIMGTTGITIANADCDENMITNNLIDCTTAIDDSGTGTQNTDNNIV